MRNYSSVRLEITSFCPLNCAYCHNAEYNNQQNDMSTEQILKLIQELKKKYPINKILLTGGEPLAQADVCKIIRQITDLGIKADMVTNGIMLTKDFVKSLEKSGLKRIRISIDEIGEISKMRSSINPNRLWEISKMVQETSDIEVCIHTVCSPSNVEELYDVYRKTLEVGAKRWRVFDLGYQGGITENKYKFNFDTYYDALIDSTKKILIHYLQNGLQDTLDIEINNIFRTMMLGMKYEKGKIDVKKALEARILSSPCDYVTDHQITVRSSGLATLCQYFHNTIFDFKGHEFDVEEAVSNQKSVVENELIMQELEHCSDCKYCLVCNSGCRSRALFITGDIRDADPSSCYLIPRIHKELIPLLPEDTQKVYNAFVVPNGLEPKYTRTDLLKFLHIQGY